MAPENRVDKNDISSIPISLLWAHQLRREHTLIVNRVEELDKLVRSSSASGASTSSAELQKLGPRLDHLERRINEEKKKQGELQSWRSENRAALNAFEQRFNDSEDARKKNMETHDATLRQWEAELERLAKSLEEDGRSQCRLAATVASDRDIAQEQARHLGNRFDVEVVNLRSEIKQTSHETMDLRSTIHVLQRKLDQVAELVNENAAAKDLKISRAGLCL